MGGLTRRAVRRGTIESHVAIGELDGGCGVEWEAVRSCTGQSGDELAIVCGAGGAAEGEDEKLLDVSCCVGKWMRRAGGLRCGRSRESG